MRVCLQFDFCLFSVRYVRYLMAFWCLPFIVLFTLFLGMLRSLSCIVGRS
jgi:hypothetical protein